MACISSEHSTTWSDEQCATVSSSFKMVQLQYRWCTPFHRKDANSKKKIIFVYYLLCATAAATTTMTSTKRCEMRITDPCSTCDVPKPSDFFFVRGVRTPKPSNHVQSVSRHTSVSSPLSCFGLNIYMILCALEEVHFPKINA